MFVLVIGYHFSGAETIFCKDTITSVASHNCSVCHHNVHIANSKAGVLIPAVMPSKTLSSMYRFSPTQDHFFTLLRPPISL